MGGTSRLSTNVIHLCSTSRATDCRVEEFV
jgi:hypothetical protein